MNNYEKIKAMTLDEMAQVFNEKYCEECAYKDMNFNDWKDCDADCWAHIKNGYYKQWLQQESEG